MANYRSSYTTRYDDTIQKSGGGDGTNDNVRAWVDEFKTASTTSAPTTKINYETGGTLANDQFILLSDEPSGYTSGYPDDNTITSNDEWDNVWGLTINNDEIDTSHTHMLLYRDANNWIVAEITLENNADEDTWSFRFIDQFGTVGVTDGEQWSIQTATTLAGLTNYTQPNATLANDTVSIIGDIAWNGQIGGTVSEVISFDKTWVLENGSRCYSTGVNGVHWWIVNGMVYMDGPINSGDPNNSRFSTNAEADGGGIGTRTDTITSVPANKSSETSMNLINTTVTYSSRDSDESGSIVVGTMRDVDLNYLYPDGEKGNIFPMNGSILDGVVWNAGTSNFYKREAYQIFAEPSQLDRLNLINFGGYVSSDSSVALEVSFTDFEAVSNYPTAGEANASNNNTTGTNDVFTLANFSSTNGNTVNMVSPKTEFTTNGAIKWRGGSGGTFAADIVQMIMRQRIQRSYVDEDGANRKDVRMYADTEVSFTTTTTPNGSFTLPPVNDTSLSKTERRFTSNTTGQLVGTWNFNTGQVDSAGNLWGTEDNPIDLPVAWLRRGTAATDRNSYSTTTYPLETDFTEMSLWGDRFVQYTRNGESGDADNVLTTTPDANGFYISPNIDEGIVDADDPMMVEYGEDEGNVTAPLTAETGTVSFNDLGANWKLAVWDLSTGNFGFGNWSSDVVGNSSFDITNTTRNRITFNSTQVGTTQAGGDNDLVYTVPIDSNNTVQLVVDPSDYVQTLSCDEIGIAPGINNNLTIDGGNLNVDIIDGLRTFSSRPTDFDNNFSIKNTTILDSDGSDTGYAVISGDGVDGEDTYIVLHDLGDSRIEIENNTASTTLTVLTSGTTRTTNIRAKADSVGTVSLKKVVTVTFDGGSGYSADTDDFSAGRYKGVATDDTLNDVSFTSLAASDFSTNGSVFTLALEIDPDENLYLAVAFDGYQIVSRQNTGGADIDLDPIVGTQRLNFSTTDQAVWGGVNVSSVTIGRNADGDAFTAATDEVIATITPGGLGGAVTPENATDVKVRAYIRRNIQESDNYLDGAGNGYIPDDLFTWDLNQITIPADDNSKFQLNRIVNTAESWRLAPVIRDTDNLDLFDTQTKSGLTGEQIYFTPFSSGATVAQVQAIIDIHEDSVKGPDDRDITEAYEEARRAKNNAAG